MSFCCMTPLGPNSPAAHFGAKTGLPEPGDRIESQMGPRDGVGSSLHGMQRSGDAQRHERIEFPPACC